jgi:hypothetical protein
MSQEFISWLIFFDIFFKKIANFFKQKRPENELKFL